MTVKIINQSLLSRLWAMSWPTVLYSLLESSVGLVDIFFASYLGSEAVAAIGFSRQIFLVLMIGTLSITTGTITLVSQYCGAKRYDAASSIASHSLLLSISSGLFIGFIGVFLARYSLILLGAEANALYEGTNYLQVLMGGVVFLMIGFSTNGVFRALGDAYTPLKIATLVNALNILFSYVFIFGFGPIPAYGVMGAAIGTVLARIFGSSLAVYMLMRKSRQVRITLHEGFSLSIVKQILDIGLPSGFSGFFRNGARVLFFRIIATTSAGSVAVAVATIGFQLRMLNIMPALAFQVATATLVGQCIGAKKIDQAEAYGWTAIKFCSSIMAAASLLILIFPGFIMRIFSDSIQVIEMGIFALRLLALEQFCNSVSIIVSGALSGAGDTKPSLRYTILSQWLLMLPLAYWLSNTSLDISGAWIAWGFAPIIQTFLTLRRFIKGAWKKMHASGVVGVVDELAD